MKIASKSTKKPENMGRKRKNPADNWMPQSVRIDKKGNRYIVRSAKLTGGKEVRLCSLSATKTQVWAAYEALLNDKPSRDSLGGLVQLYFESTKFKSLAPRTQSDYHKYHNSLKKITFNKGTSLLDLSPVTITKGVIQQILDKRAADGATVSGNREVKGLLSAVFTWALGRDMIPGMQANPCHGVRRNKESGDKRYVEDVDYYYAIKHADKVPEFVGIAMELSYLLFNRISETLLLKRQDLLAEGVYVGRLKGSKHNIVEWSPRLEEVVNKALSGKVKSLYLVHDENGQPVKYWTLRKHWDLLMKACEAQAKKDGLEFSRFNRHQLKAKGITDGDKNQNSAGHKSDAVRQSYIRKPETVKPAR